MYPRGRDTNGQKAQKSAAIPFLRCRGDWLRGCLGRVIRVGCRTTKRFMKKLICLSAVLAASALLTLGQNVKGGQALMQLQTGRKGQDQKPPPVLPPPKASGTLFGKKVFYGGYLAEFHRAERKRAFFSLLAPLDPEKDVEHVAFYPGAENIQGFVFFTIKF
jgi:hypothetical protein